VLVLDVLVVDEFGEVLDVALGGAPGAGAGLGLGSAGGRARDPTADAARVADPATFDTVLAASETLPTRPRSRACSTASLPLRAA
jgi:hypothetical protein